MYSKSQRVIGPLSIELSNRVQILVATWGCPYLNRLRGRKNILPQNFLKKMLCTACMVLRFINFTSTRSWHIYSCMLVANNLVHASWDVGFSRVYITRMHIRVM
jgi:hypothetical protein